MTKCLLCNTVSIKGSDTSFHKFPNCPHLKKLWLHACKLPPTISRYAKLCSIHFTSNDIQVDRAAGKRKLKCSAIPSLHLSREIKGYQTFRTPNFSIQHVETCTSHEIDLNGCLNPGVSNNEVEIDAASTPVPIVKLLQASDEQTRDKTARMLIEKIPSEESHQNSCEPEIEGQVNVTAKRVLFDNNHGAKKHQIWNPKYLGVDTSHLESPRKRKRYWESAMNKIKQQRREIKILKQSNKRMKLRLQSLKDLLTHLNQKKLISDDAQQMLLDMSSDTLQLIIKRTMTHPGRLFSPALRSFALTLQFYSTKAYNYVRRTFKNVLPHPATLRRWYQVVDGQPGFTKEAFNALKLKGAEGKEICCNLVIDEMSIRQEIEWDGKTYHGFVDLGTNYYADTDFPLEAKNVLVFLLVALNNNWKIPVGNTCGERANLLTQCLNLCHESHVRVPSLTFDGAAVNISMCTALGASFDYGNDFRPYIYHPITKAKIFTIWDACHMLKLLRNTLGDKEIIIDPTGNAIQWKFIVLLQNLQETQGLHAGTKLTKRHTQYKSEKMNVKLAAQTFSSSVASALLFSEKELCLPEFQGAEFTAYFCEIINNVFDILNSRNVYSKREFNLCISEKTFILYSAYIKHCIEYLSQLRTTDNILLIKSSRKTGFLGMIICLQNVIDIYQALSASLSYLLTYKLSQDHLEVFFSAVRSYGRFNNNPSALQFKHIYKRMLVRHQIKGSESGNCVDFESVSILHVTCSQTQENVDSLLTTDTTAQNEPSDDPLFEHNYFDSMAVNPYIDGVIGYISGFVARSVLKQIECEICSNALTGEQSLSVLQNIKNRGGLINASKSVLDICLAAEQVCRQNENILFSRNINITLILLVRIKRLLVSNIFCSGTMLQHILNQDYLSNHRNQLIDLVISSYLKLRLHHSAKTLSVNRDRIRQKYNHLILFNNQ